MSLNFYTNDLQIPDYRLELWSYERDEDGVFQDRFLVDISHIALSDISLTKERNKADSLSVDIEYTQFQEKLQKEMRVSTDVLKPFTTYVKLKRNFTTIFYGYIVSFKLNLSAVGSENLSIQALGLAERFDKRIVSNSYYNMSYPEMALAIIRDAQHELNWIENYAFESSTDEYFSGWVSNDGNKPQRMAGYKNSGVYLTAGRHMTTNTQGGHDYIAGEEIFVSVVARTSETSSSNPHIAVEFLDESSSIGFIDIATVNNYTIRRYEKTGSFNRNAKITRIRIHATNINLDISDIQVYRKPKKNDFYDLGLEIPQLPAEFNSYERRRVRHLHRANVKEELYKLANNHEQPFEWFIDENRTIQMKIRQGSSTLDKIASYPGEISDIQIERNGNEVCNVMYGNASLQITKGDQTTTKLFNSSTVSKESMKNYGALIGHKSFENIRDQAEMDEATKDSLQTYDEVLVVPELSIESNLYNPGNVQLGDLFGLKVLTDSLFDFYNGEYRVYAYKLNVSKEHVERMKITLAPLTVTELNILDFPKTLKNMENNIKRIMRT